MVKDKLESAENCLEVIEALFEYYLERWKKIRDNKKIVDDFYGCFLVDLEHTFKEKFPEVKAYIQ